MSDKTLADLAMDVWAECIQQHVPLRESIGMIAEAVKAEVLRRELPSNKKASGRILDGRTWDEFPEELDGRK